MAVNDAVAQVQAWAADEVRKQPLGEDFGVAVTFSPAMVPPGRMVPAWTALLTAASPLVGDGDVWCLLQLGQGYPAEAEVRKHITAGLRALRGERAKKLAGMNGKAPLPAGRG